jgi:hypothetical protein
VSAIVRSTNRSVTLSLVFSLLSCSAPPYDDQADAQATALQKEVDSQIVKFITDGTEGDPASLTGVPLPPIP